MARKSTIKLEKVTINLVAGDKSILMDFFPAIGWSVAARTIIHRFCKRLAEIDSQKVKATGLNVDIPTNLEDFYESDSPAKPVSRSKPKIAG